MKVLIYSPFSFWPKHFYTSLDIALKHKNQGDDVHFLVCESSLSFCEANTNHFRTECVRCTLLEHNGLDKIGIPAENRHSLNLENFRQNQSFPAFFSLEELMAYQVEGIDLGNAVASTLITVQREPYPDIRMYEPVIPRLLDDALAVYHAIYSRLRSLAPDLFYLFNGRFSVFRPALRAARKLGIKTLVHERAGVIDRYLLTENTLPHDLEYIKKQIEKHWRQNSDFEEKKRIAAAWFTERKAGKDQSWFAFTKEQKKLMLPEGFDPAKRNIVIFNSSIDEVESVAIDNPWKKHFYNNHQEAIRKIAGEVDDDNFHFYLRNHPNLRKLDNSQTREIYALNLPSLTVIPPTSEIDTYALMEACEKVLAFRSTTGIESAFWQKPVILIGRAFHEELGSCYVPQSHQEVLEMLKKDLDPLPAEGALKFGYWESTKGEKLEYTHHEIKGDEYTAAVLGEKIEPVITEANKGAVLRVLNREKEKTYFNQIKLLEALNKYREKDEWSPAEKAFLAEKAALAEKETEELLSPQGLKISICIITRDEERNLERCLKSIQELAWEIIVLDTGSTDKTAEIAARYGKVYRTEWEDDFSKARNRCLEYASGERIFFIDADEELQPETARNLLRRLKSLPLKREPFVLWFNVTDFYEGDPGSNSYYKPYVFRNGFGTGFRGQVHEFLESREYELKHLYCEELKVSHYCRRGTAESKLKYYIPLIENIIASREFSPEITGYYYLHLARAYSLSGDYNGALEVYQKAMEEYREPELRIHLLTGFSTLLVNHLNDLGRARPVLEELLAVYPHFPDALFYLARCSQFSGAYDRALGYLEQAEASLKEPSSFWNPRGTPSTGDKLLPGIRLEKGRCLILSGSVPAGLKKLQEARAELPVNGFATLHLLRFFACHFNLKMAIFYYSAYHQPLNPGEERYFSQVLKLPEDHPARTDVLIGLLDNLRRLSIWLPQEREEIERAVRNLSGNA